MHLTTKQVELMRVIVTGNGVGEPADLDEILERVRYETSKQSLQFSIRALIAHKLIEKRGIEKRRGRQRVVIQATAAGGALCRLGGASSTPAYVSTVEDEDLASAIEEMVL